MNIPLVDLKAHHDPIREEIMAALERILASNAYILGPEVVKLEEAVAAYCGAKHGIGVSSGTDAILLALMSLGIGPGDEVLTPAFSFFATAGCVTRLGARPVFVDIDPDTYNIDPARIAAAITEKTKAIIPVHLYGQAADMNPILRLAQAKGLKVIEDAAQAIGSQYRGGRGAGAMGDFGCLSFFPTKNLGALGDGGMLLTQDDALAERARILRVHGAKPKYFHKYIGANFRLDALQAAVLNVKLGHLDAWTKGRQENAARYEKLFAASGLTQVALPKAAYRDEPLQRHHIYNQFVIRALQRDRLREYLGERGISTEIYYPVPFHLQECFADLGYAKGDFPESEKAAEETLALPIYPELSAEQQAAVVAAIKAFYA